MSSEESVLIMNMIKCFSSVHIYMHQPVQTVSVLQEDSYHPLASLPRTENQLQCFMLTYMRRNNF